MGMTRAGMIAGGLALAAVLTGCGLAGPLDEQSTSYDVTDKVAALRVEQTDSGSIQVVESDRTGVRVTELLSWRKNKPETSHKVEGDTLALSYKCPGTWGPGSIARSCDVSYEIEVPKGLRVEVASDSGELTLKGLTGEVRARSDSGAIRAEGLTAGQVMMETDSGDIELAFGGAPDKVVTSSDSGSISIRVPEGPYNVVATTDSGGKAISVDTDASAARRIELSTDSGNVEVAAA
ncbi:DUF4097 family beta strand repeat protein [Nonomuraea phyllanthi]|uniref:DUF4097 family beta strand repeat protein n=1 Tax=Nonomuraea phyllanthi TaxID=2219224 RepID=A0A5C4WTI7_9ACTN|nr:DUF4097 family beta strand repeat-containing protein [Nonomuraea phyllanthi]KAB8196525.1 DUF4097 family beta strand repeat protein [Nonomuraea phyllanthi]